MPRACYFCTMLHTYWISYNCFPAHNRLTKQPLVLLQIKISVFKATGFSSLSPYHLIVFSENNEVWNKHQVVISGWHTIAMKIDVEWVKPAYSCSYSIFNIYIWVAYREQSITAQFPWHCGQMEDPFWLLFMSTEVTLVLLCSMSSWTFRKHSDE